MDAQKSNPVCGCDRQVRHLPNRWATPNVHNIYIHCSVGSHVLNDHAHAEFWPCLDRGEKAISSQIARKMAISAQAAIGLRRDMTWRTYMYIIITKYQLK